MNATKNKLFDVIVTRDATESAVVKVWAPNQATAASAGLRLAREFSGDYEWTLNDNYGDSPYLGSGDDDASEVDEDGGDYPTAEEGGYEDVASS